MPYQLLLEWLMLCARTSKDYASPHNFHYTSISMLFFEFKQLSFSIFFYIISRKLSLSHKEAIFVGISLHIFKKFGLARYGKVLSYSFSCYLMVLELGSTKWVIETIYLLVLYMLRRSNFRVENYMFLMLDNNNGYSYF